MASFSVLDKASRVRMLVLDVDGILTDGRLSYGAAGELVKTFHVQDGFGIRLAQRHGLQVAVITGRNSPMVTSRMQDLGIIQVQQGREDKGAALLELCQRVQLMPEDIAYMGDDWPDLSAFAICGLSLSVPNGHPEVRQRADYQCQQSGGQGAVREAIELILTAQDAYDALLQQYLSPPATDIMR